MDYNQFILRQNRLSKKPFSELEHGMQRSARRLQNNNRFSEPKVRVNLIKINKNKLPVDFFLKKDNPSKRTLTNKLQSPLQNIQSPNYYKKAQSERLHYSPQKTSFFGFFDQQDQQPTLKISGASKYYNRKFQTREQPKRDAYPVEPSRKLNTATKTGKNELLQLFPSTHDQQLTQIIISSSKSRNLKLSPRKQLISKIRQPHLLIDPQKQTIQRHQPDSGNKKQGGSLKVTNVSMSEHNRQAQQSLNITFFNAKSTCFPPINRPLNQ